MNGQLRNFHLHPIIHNVMIFWNLLKYIDFYSGKHILSCQKYHKSVDKLEVLLVDS